MAATYIPPEPKFWGTLARMLQEHGLDEFHGRTGWVRCEPYEFVNDYLGTSQYWIWIHTPQGTTSVQSRPFDAIEDLWTRFLKEIEPLRTFGFLQRNRLEDVRTAAEAPTTLALPETESVPEEVRSVVQLRATTEGRHGRVLIDPVLHRNTPGDAYQEKFRVHAEKLGMMGARIEFRILLVK